MERQDPVSEVGALRARIDVLESELARARSQVERDIAGWLPDEHRESWEQIFRTEDAAGLFLRSVASGEFDIEARKAAALGAEMFACVRQYRSYLRAVWAVLDGIAADGGQSLPARLEATLEALAAADDDATHGSPERLP